jgi:hypothetical protein
MSFSEQFEEVEEKLNQVTEFVRIIQEEDGFPDQFFFDVRPSLIINAEAYLPPPLLCSRSACFLV